MVSSPILASWIRESDEPYFAPWFARRPDLEVRNARVLPHGANDRTWNFAELDGLLLTGGPDVSAEFLRHQTVPADAPIEEPEPARDAWEFAAVAAALERGLPILAICKGHQVLNVALGGSLLLDIRGHDDPADRDRNVQPLRYDTAAPPVRRYPRVNSSHHQALDRLGDGLEIEAWHTGDEVIEQVRLRGHDAGCIGVQYHPERDVYYAPLFDDFFERVFAASRARVRK
jgi:putative glutamine amidotransferase